MNNKETFNIEITSISDNSYNFEILKREERYKENSIKRTIPLHELIKLNTLFPSPEVSKIIDNLIGLKKSKKELVNNPYFEKGDQIFISKIRPSEQSLENILAKAIKSKQEKPHPEKDKTVLVIDNRTFSFEIDDFRSSIKNIANYIQSAIFNEIWLYNGYYSTIDGNEAEYSFTPIKLNEHKWDKLTRLAKNSQALSDDNILYMET